MEGITLYSIDYYKKSVFKGSYRGMNFRISKDGDEEEKKLLATACTCSNNYLDKRKDQRRQKG